MVFKNIQLTIFSSFSLPLFLIRIMEAFFKQTRHSPEYLWTIKEYEQV